MKKTNFRRGRLPGLCGRRIPVISILRSPGRWESAKGTLCVEQKVWAGLPLILRTHLKRATIGKEVCHGKTAEEIFQKI